MVKMGCMKAVVFYWFWVKNGQTKTKITYIQFSYIYTNTVDILESNAFWVNQYFHKST